MAGKGRLTDRGRSLTGRPERQAELMQAMLSEPDLYTAAKQLGIGVRTASRWWHDGLREQVHEARAAVHEEAWGVARGLANEAVQVVAMALRKEPPDPEERLAERLPVAQAHLNLLLRLRDSDTRREDLTLKRQELALKREALEAQRKASATSSDLLDKISGRLLCGLPDPPPGHEDN